MYARINSKYASRQCANLMRRKRKSDYSPHQYKAIVTYPGCETEDHVAQAEAIDMLLKGEFASGTRIHIGAAVILVE